jgi:peptidoglycan/xylan/chitin deacetylase (PgdA/CDA1 family)
MSINSFYLTFDGAPNPPGTDRILEVLAEHNVKATFFMEGKRLEEEAPCALRVLEAGHDIGNHSYTHPDFDTIPIAQCLEEVNKTDLILYEKLGLKTKLLRPPSGKLTLEVEETFLKLGYTIVLWSYSIKDWEGPDAKSIAERVLNQIRKDTIIVFHDHVPWVPETLEIIIPKIKEAGCKFKRISKIEAKGLIR